MHLRFCPTCKGYTLQVPLDLIAVRCYRSLGGFLSSHTLCSSFRSSTSRAATPRRALIPVRHDRSSDLAVDRRIFCFLLIFDFVARFSPDDKYSRQRVTLKMRFGLLPACVPLK